MAISKVREPDMARGEGSSSSPPSSARATVSHVEDAYNSHADHGPPINNSSSKERDEKDYEYDPNLWWSKVRHRYREPIAEFFGTFTMIIFGVGSVAQVTLSANPKLPLSSQNKGEYQSISWGYLLIASST